MQNSEKIWKKRSVSILIVFIILSLIVFRTVNAEEETKDYIVEETKEPVKSVAEDLTEDIVLDNDIGIEEDSNEEQDSASSDESSDITIDKLEIQENKLNEITQEDNEEPDAVTNIEEGSEDNTNKEQIANDYEFRDLTDNKLDIQEKNFVDIKQGNDEKNVIPYGEFDEEHVVIGLPVEERAELETAKDIISDAASETNDDQLDDASNDSKGSPQLEDTAPDTKESSVPEETSSNNNEETPSHGSSRGYLLCQILPNVPNGQTIKVLPESLDRYLIGENYLGPCIREEESQNNFQNLNQEINAEDTENTNENRGIFRGITGAVIGLVGGVANLTLIIVFLALLMGAFIGVRMVRSRVK